MTVAQAREVGAEITREARAFGRYLMGRDLPDELVMRYAEACRIRYASEPDRGQARVVEFCVRHPRLIPFIDQAAGLIAPRSLIRDRLFVMAAIAEASTHFTDDFLPTAVSPVRLVIGVVGCGLRAAFRAPLGVVLYTLLSRGRR